MKLVVKIVYIVFGALIGFVVYIMNYNTGITNNVRNQIVSSANKAYESNDTTALIKTMCMYEIPYDSNPVYNKKIDNKTNTGFAKDAYVTIYPTVNQVVYYEKKDSTTDATAYAYGDFCYYALVSNIKAFTFGNKSDNSNGTSIVFYNGEKNADGSLKKYEYKLNYTSTINKDDNYLEYPKTPIESVLYGERTFATGYSDDSTIGSSAFMLIPLSQTLMTVVADKLGNNDGVYSNDKPVTMFNLTDTNGNLLYNAEQSVNLDFTQKFFTDMKEFKEAYKLYADKNNNISCHDAVSNVKNPGMYRDYAVNKITDSEYQDALDYLNSFRVTEKFAGTTYESGYAKDVIYSAALIWQSIGIVALFAVVLFIIYILIFNFSWVRKVIFRKKEPRYVPSAPREASRSTDRTERESYKQGNQTRKNNNYSAKRDGRRNQYAPKDTAPVRESVLAATVLDSTDKPVENQTVNVVEVEEVTVVEKNEDNIEIKNSISKTEDVFEAPQPELLDKEPEAKIEVVEVEETTEVVTDNGEITINDNVDVTKDEFKPNEDEVKENEEN